MHELVQIIKNSSETNITQSPFLITLNLTFSFVLGLIYAYVYRLTYFITKKDKFIKQEMRSVQFTLVLLSVGGALIWIVVADNLVRAFGLAGALSLIRFRTVIKDPKNTIKLFYAIILGMSCGLGQYYTAIIGTIFICLVLTVQYFIHLHQKKLRDEKKLNERTNEEENE